MGLYLANTMAFGGQVIHAGTTFPTGDGRVPQLQAEGALFWPDTDPVVAAAAARVAKMRQRGETGAFLDLTMMAAVAAASQSANTPFGTSIYVNPTSGKDFQTGESDAFAVASLPELERRLRGQRATADMNIFLPATGLTAQHLRIYDFVVARAKTVKVFGTRTVVATGTVDDGAAGGYRALVRTGAGGQQVEIDMVGQSDTITAKGFVGKMLRAAVAIPSFGWVMKDVGGAAKTARMTPMFADDSTTLPTRKDLATGNAFEILTTTTVLGFDVNVHLEHTAMFAIYDLEWTTSEINVARGLGNNSLSLIRCKGPLFYITGAGRSFIVNSNITSMVASNALVTIIGGGGTGSYNFQSKSYALIDNDLLLQGANARVSATENSHCRLGTFAACDVTSSSGILSASGHSTLELSNIFAGTNAFYGKDNTARLVDLAHSCCRANYAAVVPVCVTSHATPIGVGGTGKLVADLPFMDNDRGVGMVVR